jgi:hypothetical protein
MAGSSKNQMDVIFSLVVKVHTYAMIVEKNEVLNADVPRQTTRTRLWISHYDSRAHVAEPVECRIHEAKEVFIVYHIML